MALVPGIGSVDGALFLIGDLGASALAVHDHQPCSDQRNLDGGVVAHCSCKRSAWAKAFYLQQRSVGKGHHAALRTLAFKWIRILLLEDEDRVFSTTSISTVAPARTRASLFQAARLRFFFTLPLDLSCLMPDVEMRHAGFAR
jgi:hypothetical protein